MRGDYFLELDFFPLCGGIVDTLQNLLYVDAILYTGHGSLAVFQTIPKMQDLKRENIALVEKRKAVNSQYRKAKAEKEELSIVKANIDALLKADHQKPAFQER